MFLKTYQIGNGITYCINPVHRNKTHGKSQWAISMPLEKDAFTNAANQRWLLGDSGWGLYFKKGKASYLGVARDHQKQVFVAKFVDSGRQQSWHGYPADHQTDTKDIPAESVLNSWLKSGFLRRPTIRKLHRGQPCSL